MTLHRYSARGDRISRHKPVLVSRYRPLTRLNHWITALAFVLLMLSGLAMFHPSLFFLSGLFGGGQTTRMLHPFIGIVLAASFLCLFVQMARLNLPRREDAVWSAHIADVARGNEAALPELGKYNAGQKFVFWSMTGLIALLLVTGVMMWQQFFPDIVGIPTRRIATLLHALAAICVILVFILHVYAAIWTRGTLQAMATGSVTGGWAWRHHRKWLRELAGQDPDAAPPHSPSKPVAGRPERKE